MFRAASFAVLLTGVFASAAAHAQARPLGLPDVLEAAYLSGAAGPELGRLARERAGGAVQTAESAFDWTVSTGVGMRLISQAGVQDGFLLNRTDLRWLPSATAQGDRLLSNGVRVRAAIVMLQDAGEDAKRLFNPLVNRPQLLFDVPINGSLGEPVEALRLEAARRDYSSAEQGAQVANSAYLHHVALAFWKTLALQRVRDAERMHGEVINELAHRHGGLAEKGEASAFDADQWRARASLRRLALERAQRDYATARLDLASLLRTEGQDSWRAADFSGPFPDEATQPPGAPQNLEQMVRDALETRPDIQQQKERVRAAQLRLRAAERETDSRVAVVAGFDRVLLEWSKTLGDNRSGGLRRQY